ncbi:Hypothetical protein HVR_LOCUS822, partial [uncultured virus]
VGTPINYVYYFQKENQRVYQKKRKEFIKRNAKSLSKETQRVYQGKRKEFIKRNAKSLSKETRRFYQKKIIKCLNK